MTTILYYATSRDSRTDAPARICPIISFKTIALTLGSSIGIARLRFSDTSDPIIEASTKEGFTVCIGSSRG